MIKNQTAAIFTGSIIAMFIDGAVEELVCLRIRDSDGFYPSVMYRTVRYNEFKQEHTGRMVLSARELSLKALLEPGHAGLLARICLTFREKDGNAMCSRIQRDGGSLYLHTLDGGEEAAVWSTPPVIRYAQPEQIYYWDVGLTYECAYLRADSTPMLDFFQPWRTDTFRLHPHGSDHRLYGGVRILDMAQTDYTLRLTVEDGLRCSHRVIYKNWNWSAITGAMIGLSLTTVREIDIEELTNGSHEAALRGYAGEHPDWRSDLAGDVSNFGYKLFLHETADPKTEFLVIAGYVCMT